MANASQPAIPPRIATYWLEDKLGAGFSGSIYKARNVYSSQVVAVKLQRKDESCPTNRYERGFYPLLQGGKGMPNLWQSGVEGPWDYLVIDLLGPSLDSVFRKSGLQTMDVCSVCCIAAQVIERLGFMHSRQVLHRDIQLGNCVLGLGDKATTIYMIDFGFSKRYIDPETGRHIPDSNRKRDFIGNYWFSSIGVHCKGKVPSRRDDLEAAALMFIHLLTPGGLPWTRNGVPRTDEAHERLKRTKQISRPEDLCRNMPAEFEEFLRYCRRLKFLDCPDYAHWQEEFMQLAISKGGPNDDAFVWPPPAPAKTVATGSRPKAAKPSPANTRPPVHKDMENMIKGLANLQLDNRQILGVKNIDQNAAAAVRKASADTEKPSKDIIPSKEIIELSDESEDDKVYQSPKRMPTKAAQLRKITKDVAAAADNLALSRSIQEFTRALKANSSRTLTKDGFAVLDALYKQLANPSVFIAPVRTSRRRQASWQDENGTAVVQPAQKSDRLYQLRSSVAGAQSNEALAKLVKEFETLMDRASSRTMTKEGFAFLDNTAERLKLLGS